ncbi:MAG: hypothetical protein E7178_05545 [Erysipelotrichaceae bacterium]|nr:hypothetical protein [Erysipelotrichaceae bacterium]
MAEEMINNKKPSLETNRQKPHKHLISRPLFKQSFKANWLLWLVLTLGCAGIFIVINLVIGSKTIFTNINMSNVMTYVKDEDLNWLQVLGLLEKMGFSLSRIQVMSQIDINAILNDLIYKIAGVLLPMIYVMVVSNKLVANQVNDGSMAYVLSTPTNRKTVVRTQFVFLLASVTAMYVIITACALGSEAVANAIKLANNPQATNIRLPLRSILYCLGSYTSILALGGICFGASCFFNKSSNSVVVGGGVCVVSFLGCILGLFGNKVFVAVGIGVDAMKIFDFFSMFTLVDTESMSNFAKAIAENDFVNYTAIYDWTWKMAITVVIFVLFSYIGGRYFTKKDLPL